jgi:hypothetical protein
MKAKPVLLKMLEKLGQPEITIGFQQLQLKSNQFAVDCEIDEESCRLIVKLWQGKDGEDDWEIEFEELLDPKFLPHMTIGLEDILCSDIEARIERIAERLIAESAVFEVVEEVDPTVDDELRFEIFLKLDGRDRLSQRVPLGSIPKGFIKGE